MKYFKFVTYNLKSPTKYYDPIDYSKFGKEIVSYASPVSYGACSSGIHVLPFIENIDFCNCLFSDKIIILEVKDEDIVYKEDDGKMRCKAVTPIRLANKKEIAHIRRLVCENSEYSGGESVYEFAIKFDKCRKQNTRNAVRKTFYEDAYLKNLPKR